MPRVGVLGGSSLPDAVREAGAEPARISFPAVRPAGGVALGREWLADWLQLSCTARTPDALLAEAESPGDLAGITLAALRLDLPLVVAAGGMPPGAVFAALGLVPLGAEPAEVVVELARSGGPTARTLVENFSLANALRAGMAAGAGPELVVHLSSLAREAGVIGFPQMVRVLAPETPAIAGAGRLEEHGAAGLLALMSDTLHDTPTVTGGLKEALPSPPPEPGAPGSRFAFVVGRASGTEVVCRVPEGVKELGGECRVFASEEDAMMAVEKGRVEPGHLVVVSGCGPRGGPGLLRLDGLGAALGAAGLAGEVAVLTDGVAPEGAEGFFSLAIPEAAMGGIIGLLRDGDPLRFDLAEGRIRTGVAPEEFLDREPSAPGRKDRAGYISRYAASALPAPEGAGFP